MGGVAEFAGPALSLAGSLFGGDEQEQQHPSQSSSISGFQALPKEVQNAFLQQYLPGILSQYNSGKFTTTPVGQAPTGQFSSQGLQQLQQFSNANGGIFGNGTGVNPLGTVEPLHQFQQGALGSFGGGLSGLQSELPAYQDFYNENVLNPTLEDIDRQFQETQNQFLGRQSGSGNLGAFGSSALGTQLAEQQANANRLKLDARRQGFQGAQDLRNQTLQQMLSAGNQVQQQGQNQLNALQPALQQTTPQAMSQNFAAGLNQFPASSSSTATGGYVTPYQPGALTKAGLGASGAADLFNGYRPQTGTGTGVGGIFGAAPQVGTLGAAGATLRNPLAGYFGA